MENNTSRIENLLVLILLNSIKELSTQEKAYQLNLAGFSHAEIAKFLSTTPAVVKQSVYMNKKVTKKIVKKSF